MDREIFDEKINHELKTLNVNQYINFAWRCAILALPFLGDSGSFSFWKKNDRQKYLYSIFYALDIISNPAANVVAAYDAAYDAYAVYDAADAVYDDDDVYDPADAAYDPAIAAVNSNAANVADATANAVAAVTIAYPISYTVNGDVTATTTTDANAVNAAITTAAAYAANMNSNINIKPIILKTLKTIKQGKKHHISTKIYGKTWDNFQKALEAEGCSYWGRLYEDIFENDLMLDKKSLERRMNVPEEIRKNGAAAVAAFLEEIEEKGAARLNEARIIILGEKGAGKTCIARRLKDPDAPMTTVDESTAGVDMKLWRLKKENLNIRIWDFAGHTVTHAVHQFFLSERCLYLIVYDGRSEERNRLEYWLNHMKNYGGDSNAIILVNEFDKHSVTIPINNLKEQFSISDYDTFSIEKDKTKLKKFRKKVISYIKDNPSWKKQEIPVNYYSVKEELEHLFDRGEKEKGREYITKSEFNEIAKRNDADDIEKLLDNLHSLGVSLWYKDMAEFNTLILNPEWISQGVYKIINWANKKRKYTLTLNNFKTLFKNDTNRYPEEKHAYLFQLMKHYELAYETIPGKSLIIPHLLKTDRPKELPVFPVGESIMLRYEAKQLLPPHTISRFIVRHHREIRRESTGYLV